MTRDRNRIEEEILVTRAIQRDAEALNDLLARWQERLWRYHFRLSQDEAAAWDLLQETCLSIARGIPRLREPAAFPRWIYQLAHRRFVDWVRGRERDKALLESAALENGDRDSTPARPRDDLQIALEKLSPDDRAVLVLKYVEGFSYAEIGEMLGLPVGTVRSRIHYAKEKTRDLIEKENKYEHGTIR